MPSKLAITIPAHASVKFPYDESLRIFTPSAAVRWLGPTRITGPLTAWLSETIGTYVTPQAAEVDDEQPTPPPVSSSPGHDMQHTMPWGLVNRSAPVRRASP